MASSTDISNSSAFPATRRRSSGGTFRWVFSWLVPVIVVANLPARMLVHSGEPVGPLLGRAAVAALTALVAGRLFWRTALRRYSSASS